MQEGLARRQRRAGRRAGRGPGERARRPRHRSRVDLAREGFPRWGQGGSGAGAGPSGVPSLLTPPPPHPARSGREPHAGRGAQQTWPWRNEDET